MTPKEFSDGMKVIFEMFGEQEYTKKRLDLIFEDVSDLSIFEFNRITKHFCKTRSVKQPPLPTHFTEQAHDVRKHRLDAQIERMASGEDPRQPEKLQAILDKLGAKDLAEVISSGKWHL